MSNKKEEKVCETCEWYNESRSETHGYCKVDPPVFTHLDDRSRPRFYNPTVSPGNFCSKWAMIEED